MKIEEIKQGLKFGDCIFIARITGYSEPTVSAVVNGTRNNKVVLKAAEMVARNNRSLEEQIAIMCGERGL